MTHEDLIISVTTEGLSILAMIEYDELADPPPNYSFRPDIDYCTRNMVADLATLLNDMDNVYFLRISN